MPDEYPLIDVAESRGGYVVESDNVCQAATT